MCALVTGVQTCALPIYRRLAGFGLCGAVRRSRRRDVGPEEVVEEDDVGLRRSERGQGVVQPGACQRGLLALAQHRDERFKNRQHGALGRGELAAWVDFRSEYHTSELQSLMRHSYAVFCLKKKKTPTHKE